MEPSSCLKGRVAVVTGSTRGIGLLIARSLAMAGAHIVLSSRSSQAVETRVQDFAAIPEIEALGVVCNVADRQQVETLAQRTLERFEKIDIWVNNAAINCGFGPILEIPCDRWQEVIETNLYGTYHGTTVALQHMLPHRYGKIINILGSGDSDKQSNIYLSAYASSKAAVHRFTLVAAVEYADTGLSILGLNPGLVATDMSQKVNPLTDDARQRLSKLDAALDLISTPLDQLSETVVKIASKATDGTTGKIYRCQPNLATILQRKLKQLFPAK